MNWGGECFFFWPGGQRGKKKEREKERERKREKKKESERESEPNTLPLILLGCSGGLLLVQLVKLGFYRAARGASLVVGKAGNYKNIISKYSSLFSFTKNVVFWNKIK
jgi:hypothetical protein